jgi:hypothetical protein
MASYALPWLSVRVPELPRQRVHVITRTGWKEITAGSFPLVVLGSPGYVALLSAALVLWHSLTRTFTRTATSPSARGAVSPLLGACLLAGAVTTFALLWLAQPGRAVPVALTEQLGIGSPCLLAGGYLLVAGGLVVRLAEGWRRVAAMSGGDRSARFHQENSGSKQATCHAFILHAFILHDLIP